MGGAVCQSIDYLPFYMSSILRPNKFTSGWDTGSSKKPVNFFLLDFAHEFTSGRNPASFLSVFLLRALSTQMDEIHVFSAGLSTKSVLVLVQSDSP